MYEIKDRRIFYSQITIQTLISIAAIPAALMLIIDPSGEMLGLGEDSADTMPFSDFLIPGIVLFTVIGLGTLAAGVLTWKNYEFAWAGGMIQSIGLFIWLITQVIIMENTTESTVMQVIMAIHSSIELGLGYLIYREWTLERKSK